MKYKISLGKRSGWITDSIIEHNINISKYNPLAGSSYIRLPKKVDHPRKGLINIQNNDDIKDCYKINGKQTIVMPKTGEYIKFKNYERKIKSPFMIYIDLEKILVPENNEKQNPKESYMNKYQKHIACSYASKLVRVDDKFSSPFKSYYLEKDVAYSFINNMIEESKYCSDVVKKRILKF